MFMLMKQMIEDFYHLLFPQSIQDPETPDESFISKLLTVLFLALIMAFIGLLEFI